MCLQHSLSPQDRTKIKVELSFLIQTYIRGMFSIETFENF